MPKEEAPKRKRWKWRETRTGRVADALRKQITSGHFASSQKLPTFDELAQQFDVSRFTIQNVVNQLKKEGFIHGVQRSGLYVTESPPHLHRIGLVDSSGPGKEAWPRFSALVKAAAQAYQRKSNYSFQTYYNVNSSTKTEEWKLLQEDIKQCRLAAVISLLDAFEIYGDPFFSDPPLPSYALFVPDRGFDINPKVTMVNSSYDVFVEKVLAKFKERDCKRLGWLSIAPVRYELEHFTRQGFETKPHWLLELARTPANLAYQVASLLLDQPASKRPDALMLGDENLVPGVFKALKKLKLKPGRDLEIVAHMNWPTPTANLDPTVHWLGYQVEEILDFTLRRIQAEDHADPAVHHRMKPKFLEELETTTGSTRK